eukprot:TRINITY_DN6069_c1_g1_i4.p1 TRINITY_DN6069_c1_g1~~TRINITY_DN6069_c1_g1_i4.p1  ORF type:complete len:438 (-),score=31.59 TRINITY_DN6069_c1_g1_i4:387-1700(-)
MNVLQCTVFFLITGLVYSVADVSLAVPDGPFLPFPHLFPIGGCFCYDVPQFLSGPVCCDNVDYGSKCEAYCDNKKVELCSQGTCTTQPHDCGCQVPPIAYSKYFDGYMGYCCDGQQFRTMCEAHCAGFDDAQCESGQCSGCKDNIQLCCNGISYANICAAEEAGFSGEDCVEGDCVNRICTADIVPYCCDGKPETGPSACFSWYLNFIGNREECVPGECGCVCTEDLAIYCCDGKEERGPSVCNGNCVDFIGDREGCVLGSCESDIDCESCPTNDPACCGGVQYSSICEAKCAGLDTSLCVKDICPPRFDCICTQDSVPYCCNGEEKFGPSICPPGCPGAIDTSVCTRGECGTSGACPLVYDPVCCDGITYSSECEANAQGVFSDICCPGECVTRPQESPFCNTASIQVPVCCGSLLYSSPGSAACAGLSNCVTKFS